MREYELVFILKPDLKEKDLKAEQAEVEKLLLGLGGKIEKKDVWGLKDLAYPIKKFRKGFYVKLDLKMPQDKVGEWNKKVKLNEKIIRYLLIVRATE
jgi:small subunit ribosomal protein S6